MLLLSIPIGVVIGLVLGLVGSGGALLSTPLLIMVGGFSFRDASTSALIVVLTSSTLALWLRDTSRINKRLAFWATAWGTLGAPVGVYVSALVPSQDSKLLLTAVLLLAATLTWRRAVSEHPAKNAPVHRSVAAILFVFVGFMTGLTGIGGGYLIVPVLVFALQVDFHLAIATSLVVVTFNTLVSLGLRVTQGINFSAEHWGATAVIVAAALIGTALGSIYSRHLNQSVVQKIFAILLIALSGGLVWQFLEGLS